MRRALVSVYDKTGLEELAAGLHAAGVALVSTGSTAALTTMEYEPGGVADLRALLDELVPADRPWEHNERNADTNGHSHVRAALLGPSLSVPFVSGKLVLGTWQQIVLVDFDTRPRRREVVAQIMGE